MSEAGSPAEGGRILGVDPGDARTGVAVSDPLGITAQPREVVKARDPGVAARRVAELARELAVARVVVGHPINMNGSEGPRARVARDFAARVAELVDCPVTLWDERLTSAQASRILRGRGARRRKAGMDVVSAQVMLQGYLDARSRGDRGP